MSAADLIAAVVRVASVRDLTIEEPDIEDVVKRIYAGERAERGRGVAWTTEWPSIVDVEVDDLAHQLGEVFTSILDHDSGCHSYGVTVGCDDGSSKDRSRLQRRLCCAT